MFDIRNKKISYILVSPEDHSRRIDDNRVNCERTCSILYSKDYTVVPVVGHEGGKSDKSFLAISSDNNDDDLRKDAIYLMDFLQKESIIVKYFDEDTSTKILSDGSESYMDILYESNLSLKNYIYSGRYFSMSERKKYLFPKKKEDLKAGMVIEYLNDSRWKEKTIMNVDFEYERMLKLLIKYEKLRIPV